VDYTLKSLHNLLGGRIKQITKTNDRTVKIARQPWRFLPRRVHHCVRSIVNDGGKSSNGGKRPFEGAKSWKNTFSRKPGATIFSSIPWRSNAPWMLRAAHWTLDTPWRRRRWAPRMHGLGFFDQRGDFSPFGAALAASSAPERLPDRSKVR